MIDQLCKNFTWKHGVSLVTGVAIGLVMSLSQAVAHHKFTDTSVVPDPYFTIISTGMWCPTIDEVIVEMENPDAPIGELTECTNQYAPFPAFTKPIDWFVAGDNAILISEVTREGQTGYMFVDFIELDQAL